MIIDTLQVANMRIVRQASLSLSSGLNLIHGANGSGKTSLLEAIFVLSCGRSFRRGRPRDMITWGEDELTVAAFGTCGAPAENFKAGIEKTSAATRIRFNGGNLSAASEMLKRLPVNVVSSGSFELFDGGPAVRRALLDRVLFHVEPSYLDGFKRYYNALKQRNAALRRRASSAEVGYWSDQLAALGASLDDDRKQCTAALNRALAESSASDHAVEIQYQSGWAAGESLSDTLRRLESIDRERLQTSAGPHRAELRISTRDQPVRTSLSRGQSKLLLISIALAQCMVVTEETGERPLLMVDDLAAELDRSKRSRAVDMIRQSGCQSVITAVEAADIPAGPVVDKLFHVEQGRVTAS